MKPQVLLNGAARAQAETVRQFKIEQGFVATVTSDLVNYSVMLQNGAWTYGPAVARIIDVTARLGGKTPEESKKLFAYAVKAQALRELSKAVMDGTRGETAPGPASKVEPEKVDG